MPGLVEGVSLKGQASEGLLTNTRDSERDPVTTFEDWTKLVSASVRQRIPVKVH